MEAIIEITKKIKNELSKVVIGREEFSDMALCAMLSGGHVLIEGAPGMAKSLWAMALAKTLSVDIKRVRLTSDLTPADISGDKVFANLFIADGINRTPPKTQTALLDVMEERVVTINGMQTDLPEPFMVFATQDTHEQEGTYPMPETLADRFMMKLTMGYQGVSVEKRLLQMCAERGMHRQSDVLTQISAVCSASDIAACKEEINAVRTDDSIMNYIISIVEVTRRIGAVSAGAGPRGTIALLLTAKARAAMCGRDFVTPGDVSALAFPVLRHRIALKPESEMEGARPDGVIEHILSQVKAPL